MRRTVQGLVLVWMAGVIAAYLYQFRDIFAYLLRAYS